MREQLLDAAEKMVQERGLNAVSFQQLADAVGLSKSSVFHHFSNKEALAKALVDRCQTKYGVAYAAVIDSEAPAPEKLQAIADIFEEGLRCDRLCLLASIGNSVATLPDGVQLDLKAAATAAIERYARVFEQGRADGSLTYEGEPMDAATAFLAMLEGLQILARARRDLDSFGRAAQHSNARLTSRRPDFGTEFCTEFSTENVPFSASRRTCS